VGILLRTFADVPPLLPIFEQKMIILFDTRNDTLICFGCKQMLLDSVRPYVPHTTGLFTPLLDFLRPPETLKMIIAHNHPSGVAEPSRADERITRRIKSALELVDIRLLDHLIIGDGISTSLASRGML